MSNARPYLEAAIVGVMSENPDAKIFSPTDFQFHEVNNPTLFDESPDNGFAGTEEMDDALESLVGQGLINKFHDPYTVPDFMLTKKGRDYYFSRLQSTGSLETRFNLRGERWLKEALRNIHREELAQRKASTSIIPPNEHDAASDDSESIYKASPEVPASDRYVSAKDNQPKIIETRESVAKLLDAVREDRTNDFTEKEGRLGELLALDLLLSQPQISVPFVERILNDTVRYLAKAFANNAIGAAAQTVLAVAAQMFLNGFHP